jgi:hypothetical protein
MHTRKNALLVFGLFAVGLSAVGLIAGCGGGSSDNDDRSPYVGGYTGTFTTGSNQQGTTTIQVDEDGDVTGTVRNTTINAQGPVTGKITDSGNATLTFTYTGLGSANLSGAIIYTPADGKLTGNLTQRQNGIAIDSVQVSLERMAEGGGS